MTGQNGAAYETKEQLAERLGLHPRSIERLIDDGMPSVKLNRGRGGARRFDVAEVDRWLRENKGQP